MSEFLAGRDAHLYDKTDWMIDLVPVYLNIANLPATLTQAKVERMIQEAILVWSRYPKIKLYYAGLTPDEYTAGAITVNYQSSDQLAEWYKDDVNGVCFTRIAGNNVQKGNKWTAGCRIYINADNRPFNDKYGQATMTHEFGHACGINGHNSHWGDCMYRSSLGNHALKHSIDMLDAIDPHFAILHSDLTISCPIVALGDGTTKFVELVPLPQKNPFDRHSWTIGKAQSWEIVPESKGVTEVSGILPQAFEGRDCLRVTLNEVRSVDYPTMKVMMLFTLDDSKLHLEFAG